MTALPEQSDRGKGAGSRPLRILRVTPYYAPAWCYGGPAQSVHAACRALVEAGQDVTVFTTAANGDTDLDVPLGQPVDRDGVAVHYFAQRGPRSTFYSPDMARALREHAHRFDVLHLHGVWCHANAAGRHAARRAGVPYVVTLHGTLDPIVLRQKRLKKRVYWWLVERANLRHAARLIALTEEEKRQALLLDPGYRVAVLPNGCDARAYAHIPDRGALARVDPRLVHTPYVLFLSRIHPKKGLDLLVPAFAQVSREFPGWVLVIAGSDEGGHQAVIEDLVRRHGIGDRVLFTGLVSGEKKLALLGNADLFCLPSYSEGLPTVVVEALLCARPVVISENCYMPEVAQRGAGWVARTSVEGITAGLRQAMADPGARAAFGEAGRAYAVEAFDIRQVAQRTIALYREVIAEAATAGGGRHE